MGLDFTKAIGNFFSGDANKAAAQPQAAFVPAQPQGGFAPAPQPQQAAFVPAAQQPAFAPQPAMPAAAPIAFSLDHLVELALWSATEDGELDDGEVGSIVATLSQIPGLAGLDAAGVNARLDQMEQQFATDEAAGERALALMQAVTDPQLRRLVYQLACALSGDDEGTYTENEDAFLDQMQEVFGLSDAEAEALDAQVNGA